MFQCFAEVTIRSDRSGRLLLDHRMPESKSPGFVEDFGDVPVELDLDVVKKLFTHDVRQFKVCYVQCWQA